MQREGAPLSAYNLNRLLHGGSYLGGGVALGIEQSQVLVCQAGISLAVHFFKPTGSQPLDLIHKNSISL